MQIDHHDKDDPDEKVDENDESQRFFPIRTNVGEGLKRHHDGERQVEAQIGKQCTESGHG